MSEKSIPGGYILLSRKLIESEIYDKPPLYLKVWIYLLSKAQHKKYKRLKRGLLFTNISEIREACSWYIGYRKEIPSKSKIYRIIDWLRKTGERETNATTNGKMIETTKATHGIVVKVCNYWYYQDPKNYERNTDRNSEKTTNEQRTEQHRNNINKNVKNDKNVKNKDSMPVRDFFDRYNEIAKENDFTTARSLNSSRRKKIKTRLKTFDEQEIDKMFDSLKEQDYLKNESWFNIDFLIKNDQNIEKVSNKWLAFKYKKKEDENPYNYDEEDYEV